MIKIAPALILLLTIGCSLFKPKVITAPCPPPPHVERPVLAVHALKPEASIIDVLTAYVLDAFVMDGYSRKLEALLAAYRPIEPAKVVPK